MNISSLNRVAAPDWLSSRTKFTKSCNAGNTFSDKMNSAVNLSTTKQAATASTIGTPVASGHLTDDDYKYLSSEFDPTDMSQDDYDAFLDYLLDKNIIVEDDKGYLGYGGDTICDPQECTCWYSPDPPVHNYADGNVLAYTRYQSSLRSDQPTAHFNHSKILFTKITAIFERMMEERE